MRTAQLAAFGRPAAVEPALSADRVLFLADGLIVKDLGPSSAHDILATMEEVSGR